MDSTFWVGLALGGLISIAASIAANMLNDRISKFLFIKIPNSFNVKNLSRFVKIHEMQTNYVVLITYFVGGCFFTLLQLICSLIFLLFGFLTIAVGKYESEAKGVLTGRFALLFGVFVFSYSMFKAGLLMRDVYDTMGFQSYRDSMIKKFGADAVSSVIKSFSSLNDAPAHPIDGGPSDT